jgi:hypothetical protein
MEAVVRGTVYSSSDSANVLGYGGGSLADGHRVEITYTWNISGVPLPLVANGYYDSWTNGTFPVSVPPSWIRSSVRFDRGVVIASSDYAGSLSIGSSSANVAGVP